MRAMSDRHTEVIAEIGQAHDGSVGIMHSFIDAIAQTGADTAKFQVHLADAESSPKEPFRVHFSRVDRTRQEYWRRMELTLEQWKEVKEHCLERGLQFLASPFSCAAVDLLEDLGTTRYKVGSGELYNYLMLEKIARTGKPVILSTGMSSYADVARALEFLAPFRVSITVMQCTTQYPTGPKELGLNVIDELRSRFGIPVGFSDHSGVIYAGLAAVSNGVEILEVHVTFDKRMYGPDATSSLTIDQLEQLVTGVRYIDSALAAPINKDDSSRYDGLRRMFDKSLALSRDLAAGERISVADLESKKPAGCGIPAKDYRSVLGRALVVSKAKYEFLHEEDLE